MGAHFEALIEGILMAPLDSRYTQVGFNLISVQVCSGNGECVSQAVAVLLKSSLIERKRGLL